MSAASTGHESHAARNPSSTSSDATATATAAAAVAVASEPSGESHATLNLFDLGRRAAAVRDARFGPRASFVRGKQLLATGTWRGPRDASEAYIEAADLVAVGGIASASESGARLLVGAGGLDVHRAARTAGWRSLWRLSFRSGESFAQRRARIAELRTWLNDEIALWGVMPTPEGEAEGLDTLHLVATLRLEIPEIPHVVLDVAALGPRLAQMALGFGGDELWAPIVSERALRLGANAKNPSMTRKEAAILIRGAGLAPSERTGPETYREEPQE